MKSLGTWRGIGSTYPEFSPSQGALMILEVRVRSSEERASSVSMQQGGAPEGWVMEERLGDRGQYVDGMGDASPGTVCGHLFPCSGAVSLGGYRILRRWSFVGRSKSLGLGLKVFCFLLSVPPRCEVRSPSYTLLPLKSCLLLDLRSMRDCSLKLWVKRSPCFFSYVASCLVFGQSNKKVTNRKSKGQIKAWGKVRDPRSQSRWGSEDGRGERVPPGGRSGMLAQRGSGERMPSSPVKQQ